MNDKGVILCSLILGYILSSLAAQKCLKCSFPKSLLYVFIVLFVSYCIDALVSTVMGPPASVSFISILLSILFGAVIFSGVFSIKFGKAFFVTIIVFVIYIFILMFGVFVF